MLGSVLHTFVIFTDQPTFAARTISICRARTFEDSVALETDGYKSLCTLVVSGKINITT